MSTRLPRLLPRAVSLFYLGLAGVALMAEDRVWKDASGQNEVRAEFVSLQGENVLLKRENGITISLPLAGLSKEDQEFARGKGPQEPASGEFGVLEGEQEEFKRELPKPMYLAPPVLNLPNTEPLEPARLIKSFKVLKGTVNVAKGKKVTSSDAAPIIGDLNLVTDGDADGADGSFVELMPGKQWVQIDLQATHTLQKIAVWHYHKMPCVYKDVVIQVSDDPEFKKGVTTLWNSDVDNSSGLGKGKDPTYIETNYGRVIEGKAAKARYVRLWSNGNSSNDMNHYCEVEVFAVPAAKQVK